jgi:hypothetical protein
VSLYEREVDTHLAWTAKSDCARCRQDSLSALVRACGDEGLGWPVLDDGTAVVDQHSSIKGFGCGEFFYPDEGLRVHL